MRVQAAPCTCWGGPVNGGEPRRGTPFWHWAFLGLRRALVWHLPGLELAGYTPGLPHG